MIKSAQDMIALAQEQIRHFDAESAKQLFDENPDTVVIDLREESSAEVNKLSESTNIPRGLLEMKIQKVCDNPDTLILTHCAGGGRASLAALTLQQMGYNNVVAITDKFENIKSYFDK